MFLCVLCVFSSALSALTSYPLLKERKELLQFRFVGPSPVLADFECFGVADLRSGGLAVPFLEQRTETVCGSDIAAGVAVANLSDALRSLLRCPGHEPRMTVCATLEELRFHHGKSIQLAIHDRIYRNRYVWR